MDPVTHVWWLLPAPVLIAAAAPAALSDEKAESLHLVLQAKQRCNFRDKANQGKQSERRLQEHRARAEQRRNQNLYVLYFAYGACLGLQKCCKSMCVFCRFHTLSMTADRLGLVCGWTKKWKGHHFWLSTIVFFGKSEIYNFGANQMMCIFVGFKHLAWPSIETSFLGSDCRFGNLRIILSFTCGLYIYQ